MIIELGGGVGTHEVRGDEPESRILRGVYEINDDDHPELLALRGVPQPPEHHPEVDTWDHVMLALAQAKRLTHDWRVHLAVLLHDLGKALTPAEYLPNHRGHEAAGLAPLVAVHRRLDQAIVAGKAGPPVDGYTWRLCERTCKLHLRVHGAMGLNLAATRRLLRDAGALEDPELFEGFLIACEADARGRKGLEQREYPQANKLRRAAVDFALDTAREQLVTGVRAAIAVVLPPADKMTPDDHRQIRSQTRALADTVLAISKRVLA